MQSLHMLALARLKQSCLHINITVRWMSCFCELHIASKPSDIMNKINIQHHEHAKLQDVSSDNIQRPMLTIGAQQAHCKHHLSHTLGEQSI